MRRLGYLVLLLWVVYTATFVLVYALPSDPVALMVERRSGGAGGLAPDQLAALREAYGTDRSLLERYGATLGAFVVGDLGTSFEHGQPVTALLAAAAPATLELAAAGFALATLIAVTLALVTSYRPDGWVHRLLHDVPAIAAGIPAFWLALLLMQVFAYSLGWFPATRGTGPAALVLPALALAVPVSAPLAIVLVRTLDATWRSDFVLLLQARGLPRRSVFWAHVVRGSLLPFVTLLGLTVGGVLVGTVVTETVFARAGLGRLLVGAVESQDAPVVLALAVLGAVVFGLANLAVDLLYPLLDPRLGRRESR
ncbi:ABC transporter permease [Nocardioides zeae]|uniref:Peptide/nickel transport system permease protein n=1 Tax=Nocardioides zeae TaxID=1457234 RepID=A0AAJ1U4G8_9ACTN|nr:ABC transporter permease [Nocardioides zeae]MDQ1103002.1 peptide/nickel transport system permease protein [Nocardioides zeae]